MRPAILVAIAFAALPAAVLAPTSAQAEWPHDYHLVPPLLGGVGAQHQVVDAAVPDGSGGAYAFMEDDRSGNRDVYGLHLRGDGTLDPAWPGTGLAVCTAAGDQVGIRALDDGKGAIWVCWTDPRSGTQKIFATRVIKNGTIDADFPANGLALDTARPNAQHDPTICLGIAGMLIAVWEYDFSAPDHDIYGAAITEGATFQWVGSLQNSGTNDTKPAISAEPGAFSLAWLQGTSLQYVRHFLGNGVQVGSIQLLSTAADLSAGVRDCPDGWGGTYVGYSSTSSGTFQVQVIRMFGGTFFAGSTVSAMSIYSYQLGGMVYAGGFQAWIAFWNPNSGVAGMTAVFREGSGTPVTITPIVGNPNPQVVEDGSGGAILATQTDVGAFIKGTRRTVSFGTPGLWFPTARLTQLIREVVPSAICSDGNSGALVFSYDSGFATSLARVIRADRWGALDGAPLIQSVKDVVNDQGGHVRVAWKASYLDREVDAGVASYRLWRQVPTSSLQSLLAGGEFESKIFREDSNEELALGSVRIQENASATIAWELVATQVANAFPAYSLTVESVADSTAAGPANTLYMIEARDNSNALGWASPPDSGHSVDNLPPATPAPFTGAIQGGTHTRLTWGANHEPDLAGYELYRGASAGFVPGPGNLIAATTDTTDLDASMSQFYKLAAIDSHGNRSPYALLTPSGTLDAPGATPPRQLSLALGSANPSVGEATLRYTLAEPGRVRLALFAVDGRCARELVSAELPAGDYTVRWDGRDASGRPAASGIYFARLTTKGHERVTRFALAH
jgi:hypothetical protein